MHESQLPPVYMPKEHKRLRLDPSNLNGKLNDCLGLNLISLFQKFANILLVQRRQSNRAAEMMTSTRYQSHRLIGLHLRFRVYVESC